MSNEFTFTIRSDSRNKTTYSDANSFTLKLANLPTHYKLFDVEVVACYINDSSGNNLTKYAEIQCDNLNIYGSYDTRNTESRVLATNIFNFGGLPMTYRLENFNNREINFKVVDASNTLLSVTNWIVILRLTGVSDSP